MRPPAEKTGGRAKANKGARRMPVAQEGDERRGKLRKAAGRRKQPLIRGFLNGATRPRAARTSSVPEEANAGN